MEKLEYIIEDSTIAEVLGVQNFSNEESAVLELVKNAYDAQSPDVIIIISKDQIIIEDNGIGIPKKHYHDVFKRFYRAQEVVKEEGVGLGLYLSRCIITHEKGYITVKSEVGKGTVFSVFLPASGEGINQWKS